MVSAEICVSNPSLKCTDKLFLSLCSLICVAKIVSEKLHKNGILTNVLDGDNIRLGINSNLTFSEDDRLENVRRTAEIAKLFVECGVVTICCLVSPTDKLRKLAKKIIGRLVAIANRIFAINSAIQFKINKGFLPILSDRFPQKGETKN